MEPRGGAVVRYRWRRSLYDTATVQTDQNDSARLWNIRPALRRLSTVRGYVDGTGHPITQRCAVMYARHEENGWVVCGEAATGREAVAMAAAARPDIVVLDLSMPELNGLEAAQSIHEQFPQTEILILTMHDTSELMLDTLTTGVRACVLKTDLEQLVALVRSVLRQNECSSEEVA